MRKSPTKEVPAIRISDFNTATVLLAAGHSIAATEMSFEGRVEFVFENADGVIDEAIKRHRSGDLVLPSLLYVTSSVFLKSEIHDCRRRSRCLP